METKKTILWETKDRTQTDPSCCKMKSVQGYCPKPLEMLSSFLSKKWTLSIIITIGNFTHLRFNNLQQRLERITAKTLTERLKELERERIVKRTSFHEIPPRVEYSLTPEGKKLRKALLPLLHWTEKTSKEI